jgi:ABC-2 type transport system ATP-binding protein
VRMLATLITPTSGTARVAGYDVVKQAAKVRERIGYVGQYGGIDEFAPGRVNLVMAGRLAGLSRAQAAARADELMAAFSLTEVADRPVRTLSGGQKRRFALAVGLVHRPPLVFLDEPTTGLDPQNRATLWEEIRALRDQGTSVLLTTHYLDEADRLAAELAIVDHGRIVARGTPEALKAELRGDAIHVELRSPEHAGAAARVLARVAGLGSAAVDGARVSARADHGATAMPSVLSALDGAGIAVAAVTVARPSLDDVYFRHTGRSFRPESMEASL